MEDSQPQDYFGDDVATLGDRITAAREAQGLSQPDFARKLGIKLKTAQNWEDDRTEPRANKAQMISGMLGVSVTWLLNGEGDGIPDPSLNADALPDGIENILDELRQLRTDMSQKARQIGVLEKRLRTALR